MGHDIFTEKISLWLDNELSPAERAELQAHLTDCPTCQRTLVALQRVDSLFRNASAVLVAPPPGFTQRFEAHLAQQRAYNPTRVWWGLAVLLLGTVLLLLIGGVMVGVTVSEGVSILGVPALYGWLAGFIEVTNTMGVWLNLAGTFLRACLITMSQPLFWGGVALALGMTWLWLRLLQKIYQRTVVTVELLI
jgi:hypothetical protein